MFQYTPLPQQTKGFPKVCACIDEKSGARVHPQSDGGLYEKGGLGGCGVAIDVLHVCVCREGWGGIVGCGWG